jgi:hypothetical protein
VLDCELYVYIYIYIHTHTYTHTHTHTYAFYWNLTHFLNINTPAFSLLSDRMSNLTDTLFIWWNITLCVRKYLAYIKFWGPSLLYHIFQTSVIKAEHWQQTSILFTFALHCIVFCCLLETRNSVYKDSECINLDSLRHRLSSTCSWLDATLLRLL